MTNYGFGHGTKKVVAWAGVLAVVVGLLVASGGEVHAKSTYLSTFNSTYGTSGTALNSCSLCHPGGDTKTFNPYANAFAGAGHSFTAIENADSDGDGFTNKAEITARTFPGDAASKPATTPPPVTDTTRPTVNSTSPVAGATAVPVAANVTATFSETVKSVSTATFTVMAGNSPVSGTVTLSGTTATFNPSVSLANGTTYTATITTGVTDMANNALAANKVWTFTTAAAGVTDTTPPAVTSTNPAANQANAAVNADVTATFSEAVKSVSATTFTVKAGNSPVAGTVTLSGTTATFNPSTSLANGTTYTATITTGVTDMANNALAANKVWTFTTGAAADTAPPTVTSTNPAASQTGVPANTTVKATFSETMAGASINTATFTVADGSGNPVAGTVTLAGTTATFAPSALLASGTTYTATVTTNARDLAGNGLAQARTWSFTTVAATSDTDGDGAPDNMDAFPGDNRMATVPDPMGGQGMAMIDTSANAGTRLMWADAMADTDGSLNQTGKPAGYEFPHGVVSYVVAGVVPGGTANVVITYPSSIPANSRVYKVDSAGFHEFPGAVINGNTVTLTLRDGGAGDADGQANGFIDDPVAVATPLAAVTPPAPTPAASGADSVGGGGCAMAGAGGGPGSAAGAYGFLAAIGLALLGRKAGRARRRPLP